MQGLLDGVSGDEADKVLDVRITLLEQAVGCRLAHQVLGQLSGVVYRKGPECENPPDTVASLPTSPRKFLQKLW